MSEIERATQAAVSLVAKINAPPQAHSVYVRTDVGEDKEFKRTICVSIRPTYKGAIIIPTEHAGFPVERVKWPDGL